MRELNRISELLDKKLEKEEALEEEIYFKETKLVVGSNLYTIKYLENTIPLWDGEYNHEYKEIFEVRKNGRYLGYIGRDVTSTMYETEHYNFKEVIKETKTINNWKEVSTMEELLTRINERAEMAKDGDVESDGEYFEDKLMNNELEINIDGDVYKIEHYDMTDNILYKECWTFFITIFEVMKNGEHFGYIGRRTNESCCGDFEDKKFVKAEPMRSPRIVWNLDYEEDEEDYM